MDQVIVDGILIVIGGMVLELKPELDSGVLGKTDTPHILVLDILVIRLLLLLFSCGLLYWRIFIQ